MPERARGDFAALVALGEARSLRAACAKGPPAPPEERRERHRQALRRVQEMHARRAEEAFEAAERARLAREWACAPRCCRPYSHETRRIGD